MSRLESGRNRLRAVLSAPRSLTARVHQLLRTRRRLEGLAIRQPIELGNTEWQTALQGSLAPPPAWLVETAT